MSEKVNRQARQLAKMLPVVYVHHNEFKSVQGRDILANPQKYDVGEFKDLKNVRPEMFYTVKESATVECNHAIRIMQCYRKGGEKKVAQYINWARDAHKKQHQQIKQSLNAKRISKLKIFFNKVKSLIKWKGNTKA